jgi:hypothetical protein
MKIKAFLITAILLVSFSAVAESDTTKSKLPYLISIHCGGLLGKKGNGSGLTASFINGFSFKRFAFGVGIGYDSYTEWRTFPMFGSIGYDIAKADNKAFYFQINAGYSKAWNPVWDADQFNYKDRGGVLFHPLVGYRFRNGNASLYVTVGYKFQRLNYGYPTNEVTVQHDIERLSVQIGFGIQ